MNDLQYVSRLRFRGLCCWYFAVAVQVIVIRLRVGTCLSGTYTLD